MSNMREKYESLSVVALKDLAKARGLKNISALKKAEVVDAMVAEDRRLEQLKKQTVDATAGGGVVKITMDGEKQVKGIVIDPAAVDPEDVEMLQDLLAAAFNEATKKVDEKMAGEMSKLTSSMGLPTGMF